MAFGRNLLILMWKHICVRVRRFCHTAIELLAPLSLFLLLFLIRNSLNMAMPAQEAERLTKIHYTEPLSLEYMALPTTVLYAPDSEVTSQLMATVGTKLNLRKLQHFPDFNNKGYYGLSNNVTIDYFVNQMRPNQAVVFFKGMEDKDWPRKLNYTIRMKEDYMTHLYNSLDSNVGSHEKFGTVYETFMCLQWAIDASYLELMTGSSINQTLALQEFPYVEKSLNSNVSLLCSVLPFLCWLSLLLPFIFTMTRLKEERCSGAQELIKMTGVSPNTIGLSHFLNALPCCLLFAVVATVLLKVSDAALIPKSNGLLIFVFLMLYYSFIISIAFAASYITKTSDYMVVLSVLVYAVLWAPANIVSEKEMSGALRLLTGLLPHVPLMWFWKEVGARENFREPIDFSSMWTTHGQVAAYLAYIFLGLQMLFFFLISWYLSKVRPGLYGIAEPWNFFWQRQKKVSALGDSDDVEECMRSERDPQLFEEPPKNAVVGIKIDNVTKVFNRNRALDDVSFDVYQGEITVLLGHNGAGKTTLMSIITGMLNATDGRVYVNGLDIVRQQSAVRRHLGLCPQHNLFFPDLTVMEHLMFFALLKGGTVKDAGVSSRELLKRLLMSEKADDKCAQLSGGMKRRLQLACALSGGASVLVLDEPTSGLDVETRRELWDLLLSLRGERTVLLTTHFMEEADALGDRVAALHNGRLRCFATPMHLKKNVGQGYRLSLTTVGVPREAAITREVTSHVSDAMLREKSLNSITYDLPSYSSAGFPEMFQALESKRSELGIDTIGMGVSTLEEVFLQLCSDVDTSFEHDATEFVGEVPKFKKVSGWRLYARQFSVLTMRRFYYLYSKKISFLLLQVLIPILMIVLFVYISNANQGSDGIADPEKPVTMNLDMYEGLPERRVLYSMDDAGQALRSVGDRYPSVEFQITPDVADAVLRAGKEDMADYNKYLVGVELNDTDAKVLYTTTVRHAAPVALNLLSNMLAARLLPWADGRTIVTSNQPYVGEAARAVVKPLVQPKEVWMLFVIAFFIGFFVLSTVLNAATLLCREREFGTRHIHVLSGCSPLLHWLTTLFFHLTLYILVLVVPTIIAMATFEEQSTIDEPHFLGALFVVLTVVIMAFLSFCYFVSFYVGEKLVGVALIIAVVVFGLITGPNRAGTVIFNQPVGTTFTIMMWIPRLLMPPHTAMEATIKTMYVARLNAYCTLNKALCPAIAVAEPGFDLDKCCVKNENPVSYFTFEKHSPVEELMILLLQFVVYMTLVLLLQHGVMNGLWDKLINRNYRPKELRFRDEIVRAEKTYVEKNITLPPKQIPDAMLVNDVHKNYFRSNNAVKGVSFSVKQGECFGLLGVNGAGKSTTFKMLTGEESATRGSVFANQHHLRFPRGEYLHSLGYCPQFFGLDDFLTGKQNIALLLTLRGLDRRDVRDEVAAWIAVVGLERYRDVAVSGYSGGCQRRLASAAALSSGAPVTLLDEPTAGVDVSARRRVWSALRRGLGRGQAVVITSHSLDEIEALCSRVAIMAGGELCALGSPAALRAAYATGHAVRLKVNSYRGDVTDGGPQAADLKGRMQEKFNCSLKDEHATMLHYHINETMRYSELFSKMEELKAAYPALIEDYSVTETTLEEVFLGFAEEARKPAPPSPAFAV